MRIFRSITFKIRAAVVIPLLMLGAVLTAAGSLFAYSITKNDIIEELENTAYTLKNLYDVDGGIYFKDNRAYCGDTALNNDLFIEKTRLISSADTLDFTVFSGNIRVLTTLTDDEGSYVLGTSAPDIVAEKVLGGDKNFCDLNLTVNGTQYVAYYIPIYDADNSIIGMIFTGMPLSSAKSNMVRSTIIFVLISAAVIFFAALASGVLSKHITDALHRISEFTAVVASGDFSASLPRKLLNKSDEIGELAKHSSHLSDALQKLVENDALTGLLNRRSAIKVLNECNTGSEDFCLIMGDIDNFKKINDTYGHICGDAVLKGIAEIMLNHCAKNNASAVRWGGEEFIIIYKDRSPEDALPLCDRLGKEIREMSVDNGKGGQISVTMTMGMTRGTPGCNIDELINSADTLLYSGKSSGKDRIVTDI